MKKQKVTTSILIEMCYMLAETVNEPYSNVNIQIANRAHTNDAYKKTMYGGVRANFCTEFNTKDKTLGDLLKDATILLESKEMKHLTIITQKLQRYIVDNSELIFPELKLTNDQVMQTDFTHGLVFEKTKMTYRTNIYRQFTIDLVEAELCVLDFLQEYVDSKLDQYINLGCAFMGWRYLVDEKMEYTLQDFINHRRANLKLKDNSHLIK